MYGASSKAKSQISGVQTAEDTYERKSTPDRTATRMIVLEDDVISPNLSPELMHTSRILEKPPFVSEAPDSLTHFPSLYVI